MPYRGSVMLKMLKSFIVIQVIRGVVFIKSHQKLYINICTVNEGFSYEMLIGKKYMVLYTSLMCAISES